MISLKQGNCLELMKQIPNESVDLVLTDPPYGISRNSNFGTMNRQGTYFGEWDTARKELDYLEMISLKTKKGGHVVMFNSVENIGVIMHKMNNLGFDFKNVIVWNKSNPMPRNRDRRLVTCTELGVLFTKKGAKWTFNRTDDKYNRNVFNFPIVSGKKRKHPTQKPVEFMEELIRIFTNVNDTVLDCFAGSGSTGVACVNTNRNFIGMELDKGYFEIANQRIKEAQNGR